MADADFQSFIDELIERNDITDVISEYAKVKRVGNRFAALCPLHNDKKSPSLSISPDKQLFHCFGCGAGGNVIHFIQAAEHLDFMDAVRFLADRAKIDVPEFKSSGQKPAASIDKKQLIYNVNREAARYFYSKLAGDEGKDAYAYLKNRGIKNSTIKMFGIGYAPEGWTNLIDYLKEKGYSEHDVYEAGLAKQRDNGTYYDAFYDGRVMFPIINVQGNIIGFGGRIMVNNPNTGKYLNSPETYVFKKKENLFGLNLAKNDRAGSLLLMEGYMDVISLHQAGITNAVASLGTAFTDEQAKLVKRYGGKAVLCYDSDEAGKKATLRAGEILTKNGIKTRVLTITDGKDPDEYVQAKGGDMFRVLMEQAKPLFEYRIDEIQKQYSAYDGEKYVFPDTEHKIEFTEAAAKVLSEIPNQVEYEIYVARVSEKSGVTVDSLNATVNNLRRLAHAEEERSEEQRMRRLQREETKGVDNKDVPVFRAERLLLSLMCERAVFRNVVKSGITAEHFSSELHRKLARRIEKFYEDSGNVDINRLLGEIEDDGERNKVTSILFDDKYIQDKEKASIQPIETILAAVDKSKQNEILESGDLMELDKMLKAKAKKS